MSRRILSLLAALCVAGSVRAENLSPVKIYALTCEHLTNPVGIGNQQPRLSWKLRSDHAGEIQIAWQIRAASSAAGLKAASPDIWDSGKIISDQSVLVPWAGKPLNSRSQVFWQVRIWDKYGLPTAWSDAASFELGLLDAANEWKGKWITAELPRYDIEQTALAKAFWINAGSTASQVAAIRLAVELPANAVVRLAFIDVAADGLITNYVNGHPAHPGFTSLTAPLHVEIGGELTPGKNIIAISSAAVRSAIRRDRGEAGRNAIAGRGVIELADGRQIEFNTDGSWKAAVAPSGNWFAPDFDDSGWATATVVAPYSEQLSKYYDIAIGPGRYLRKNYAAAKPITKARLYATALGVYEASINGQRVGNDLLAPGWTDYTKRVMVQTYDVTKLIQPGQNAIGVVLADGWYAGRLGWMGAAQYGTRPVFNAQLEITYADGSTDVIATDDSWKAGPGEIIGSDEQWGEINDAQKAVKDWNQPSFNDSAWKNAVVEEHAVALVPQLGPPVRALMELAPQKITRSGEAWIVDFGQNVVGHVRLTARGLAGTTVTVRHAETINSDGSLYTENLRTALATDKFTLDGSGRETLEPHFTFHGFRYVEITGYPGKLTVNDLRAIVVGSDTQQTGTFECSNPDLNRLYQNIVWSQRGNFLSVPTDCPQRDERLGWMGDAQVFAPTAARNADVAAFFTKWMVDVDDAQGANGEFSTVSPRANQNNSWPVWGDAGVIIPWAMFTAYGDKAFLADNYEHMAHWVDYCKGTAPNLILSGGVGDHLAPRPTPVNIVDTAYFANSARIVAKAAALLGKTEDAAKYGALQRDITTAFNTAFVGPDGSTTGVDGGGGRAPVPYTPPPPGAPRAGNTQTAYLLALQFNLLPENLRAIAAQRLAENVETNGHLTTGFVGVGLICPVLTQIGRSELAWDLVLTNTYPSWLFSVKNGATTIWERWDGWTPERGFQDSSMNSFNHYSLGSVGAWLYSGAAGIQPDDASPGYKHFFLEPQFTTRLSHVKATLDSPYGVIASGWRIEKDQLLYDVTIPPNSSAMLVLPVPPQEIRQSGQPLHTPDGSITRLPLAAGTYHFSLPPRFIR
jgi:alpha-L-rhamnosidase